jgi:hypothetical protein
VAPLESPGPNLGAGAPRRHTSLQFTVSLAAAGSTSAPKGAAWTLQANSLEEKGAWLHAILSAAAVAGARTNS